MRLANPAVAYKLDQYENRPHKRSDWPADMLRIYDPKLRALMFRAFARIEGMSQAVHWSALAPSEEGRTNWRAHLLTEIETTKVIITQLLAVEPVR